LTPSLALHGTAGDTTLECARRVGRGVCCPGTGPQHARVVRSVLLPLPLLSPKFLKSERLSPLQALAPSFVRGAGWCSGATARTRATRVTVDGHQPLRMREMGRLNGGQCLAQVRGCARLVFAHSCTRGRLLCDGCVAWCPRGLVVRRRPVRTRIGSRRAPGRRWRWLGARR
jgi:hypothetical protein